MNELEKKILNEFRGLQKSLEKWGAMVDGYIMDILDKDPIIHHLKIKPKYRLKAESSYLEKAIYRNKRYKKHLEDIEDKVGTRIVLLKSDDVTKVAELLLGQTIWQAKKTKDTFDYAVEEANLFSYQSLHLVCKPPENSVDFPAKEIPCLTCEIQIRTLLQHAFAEISHDSTYKGVYRNDKDMLRKLAKSMALMEATDDYFCEVFEMMADQKRYYRNYLNELIIVFKKFVPTFQESDLDYKVSDTIFELLQITQVDVDAINVFTQRKEKEVRAALTNLDSYLTKQPIILILLFFIETYPNQLKENWFLSESILKEFFNSMGISYDSY